MGQTGQVSTVPRDPASDMPVPLAWPLIMFSGALCASNATRGTSSRAIATTMVTASFPRTWTGKPIIDT
jgi:hypothetical protein